MTELSDFASGLKTLEQLSGKTRKADRETAALTKQVLRLGRSLASLTVGKSRGLDPLSKGLADLSPIAARAARKLETVFGAAFGKLIIKGADFKSVVKGLEGDLLSLGHQAFRNTSGTSSTTTSSLLSGAASSVASLFPGFATGGSFTVGGAAGVDRNLMGLRLTRGEKITVQTPAQQRKNTMQEVAPNINLSFNISTPDADSFRRSQAQIQSDALRAAQRQLKRNG